MNWIAETDTNTFEGGEFSWYAIETRQRSAGADGESVTAWKSRSRARRVSRSR